MSYFESLGKVLSAELARNPAQRERLRSAADGALGRHLGRPMAYDAMPRPMAPRGGRNYDQDPNDPAADPDLDPASCIDADSCLRFVELLLRGLDDDERSKLVEGLANLIQGEGGFGGGPDRNGGALDHRRRRGAARDQQGRPAAAMDSAAAALNHKAFLRRFPIAAGIRFGGTGR